MKGAKVVGIFFLVFGLLFAILGSIEHIVAFKTTDERIYATAHIVRIDEQKTKDPEFPIEHTAFVEFETGSKKVTAKLNTYNSSFTVGKQVDIYYFENDLQMVYEVGSDAFYIIFASVGLIFAILGTILIFRKKHIVK
ncbi:MAG: hypothetical protein IJ459_04365 [Clostridia bacterium]|nr:hypothetical protein [Clostridia bacterium]